MVNNKYSFFFWKMSPRVSRLIYFSVLYFQRITKKKRNKEKMIVWLTGSTSAGKTWLGDFLKHYHNFIHLDGDVKIVLEGESDAVKGLIDAFYKYWFDSKEAPLELWVPYYQELCERVIKQYKETPETDIVLSFSTYPRVVRDYVRAEIKRGTGQDLVMVLLDMSKDDYARRQKDKLFEWAKAHNKTVQEIWEDHEKLKAMGEYDMSKLEAYYREAKEMRGVEPIQEDEENSFTIDTNGFHVKVVPEITRILKLKECPDLDNDVIMKMRSERLEGYARLKEEMKKGKS
uniref:Uncharacterized protein n=1 Tax=Clytia hemisphaerica TaxID=252671 RepID=A0A7M5WJ50_9CNID